MIFKLDLSHLHKLDPIMADEKYLSDLMYHFSVTNSYCPSPIFSFIKTSDYNFLIIDSTIHGAIDCDDSDHVWLSDKLREEWESI